MGSSANITSVAEIDHLRLALKSFEEDANDALTSVMMQIRRTVDWVGHDQLQYWQMRVKRGYDEVAEARTTLERCQMFALDGERRGCDEEKKAFEKAKRRLRDAQEKVEVVKKWARVLNHEVSEYQAAVGLLDGWIEGECPKAIAALDRMSRSLEAYLSTEVPMSKPMPAAADGDSVTQPAETSAVPPEPKPVLPDTSESKDKDASNHKEDPSCE